MNKLSIWMLPIILALACAFGCSGGGGEESNQALIDKYNKQLPPIDPNAPPPTAPVREDLKGGGNMPMKGGK
jgi:hypothetical protein